MCVLFFGHFSQEHFIVWYQFVVGGILSLLALNSLYYRFPQVAGTSIFVKWSVKLSDLPVF